MVKIGLKNMEYIKMTDLIEQETLKVRNVTNASLYSLAK